MERRLPVQCLHIGQRIAERMPREIRANRDKSGGSGAVGEHAVERAEQAAERLLLRRSQAYAVEAVLAWVERVVVEIDQHRRMRGQRLEPPQRLVVPDLER